jgi:replicative DNA helicase
MKGVQMPFINEGYITNPELLRGTKFLFVVEGWADAYSIEEVGGKATALNSVSNAGRFLKLCEANQDKLRDVVFVTSGDNDKAGKIMNSILYHGIPDYNIKGLHQLHLSSMPFNVSGSHKDANEFLVADRSGFQAAIQGVLERRLGRFRSSSKYMEL